MKKKSIVIDFVVLNKLGLTLNEFMYLNWIVDKRITGFNFEKDNELSNLQIKESLESKKYIKLDSKLQPEIRQSGIDLIDFFSIESFDEFNAPKIIKKSKKRIKAEVVGRIDEYRSKWKGLKAGSMGDRNSCIEKLSRWMENNPEYSFDDILKAADLYLDTEGRNLKFLQKADFFIYKQDANKIDSSRLSAFIDDISEDIDSDWTSTIN